MRQIVARAGSRICSVKGISVPKVARLIIGQPCNRDRLLLHSERVGAIFDPATMDDPV
jgi:hypothetical protein